MILYEIAQQIGSEIIIHIHNRRLIQENVGENQEPEQSDSREVEAVVEFRRGQTEDRERTRVTLTGKPSIVGSWIR